LHTLFQNFTKGNLLKFSKKDHYGPLPNAYFPYPQITDCTAESAKLECTPQAEHDNAQGIHQGNIIDLSQGQVSISISDNYLIAQENLYL
jgi:hypothetical protein